MKKGSTGSDLEEAAKSLYGCTRMSIELRIGGPKGTLIGASTRLWTALEGDASKEVFCVSS